MELLGFDSKEALQKSRRASVEAPLVGNNGVREQGLHRYGKG
jgi:hypothetical protein